MVQHTLVGQFNTLPPTAQQQVIDFMAFLQTRYELATEKVIKPRSKLANEAFIGMWQDREDIQDSGEWIRHIRATEWGDST